MTKWREAALSDVAKILLSNVDKKIFSNEIDVLLCNYMDVYANRYINSKFIFSLGSVNKQELDKFRLNENDVIITKDSETADDIAVPAVVTENINSLVCGYHLAIIRPHSDQLDGFFLMNLIQIPEVKNQFSNHANGITRYGLTKDAIYNIRLRFPIFLPEQRKIARILSTVDAMIEKTEQAIAKYKAIKQGMMHDLFTRGLDENGKLRPRYEDAPDLYKKTELGWVPKAWEVVRCETLFKLTSGKTKSQSMLAKEIDIYPVYGGNGITGYSSEYLIDYPSIIIGRVGEYCGATYFINYPTWITDNALYIEKCFSDFDMEYFFHLFHYFDLRKRSSQTGQPLITQEIIGKILVQLPKKIEQEMIVRRLNNINVMMNKEEKNLNKYRNLKLGLMHDLLTGRKRVKITPPGLSSCNGGINSPS